MQAKAQQNVARASTKSEEIYRAGSVVHDECSSSEEA